MSSLPVVFTADPLDLRAAVQEVRKRVGALAESRLYMMAVVLAVLSREARATAWRSWDSAPPTEAQEFGRTEITWAMWKLFGTTSDALLHGGSNVRQALGGPSRVMLDVLYSPKAPPTLVAERPASGGSKDSVKLAIEDGGWVWSDPHDPGHPTSLAEYNPDNTRNQQNGIACALPAAVAVKTKSIGPGTVYAVPRNQCAHRNQAGTKGPVCSLNGKVCGGSGGGGARGATKPRLLVPPTANSNSLLLTPYTLVTLVDQAKANGALLPRARDLSLIASWCAANGTGAMDNTRLLHLLGASGIALLTDQS